MTRHIFSEKISFIYFKIYVHIVCVTNTVIYNAYVYVQIVYIIYVFTVEIHTMFFFIKSLKIKMFDIECNEEMFV